MKLRQLKLHDPHAAPLAGFVRKLRRKYPTYELPDFDPLDGGTNADMLFLFEKPGPKTSKRGGGSGFISRDNDDRTAEATFGFMEMAGIPRARTVIWNVIPGWNCTRRVKAAELRQGVDDLKKLHLLLPKLQTIIFVGRKAERARPLFEPSDVRIFCSAHPSPIVRGTRPDMWKKIPSIWAQALKG